MLMWGYGDAETEYRAAGPLEAGSGFKFWLGDADGSLRTSALGKDPTGNAGPGDLFGALVARRDRTSSPCSRIASNATSSSMARSLPPATWPAWTSA